MFTNMIFSVENVVDYVPQKYTEHRRSTSETESVLDGHLWNSFILMHAHF